MRYFRQPLIPTLEGTESNFSAGYNLEACSSLCRTLPWSSVLEIHIISAFISSLPPSPQGKGKDGTLAPYLYPSLSYHSFIKIDNTRFLTMCQIYARG